MNQQNNGQVEEVNILGNSHDLINAKEKIQVLKEFMVDQQHYVLLRSEKDHPDDCYLFRVSEDQFEDIEDEIEWERISEAIDEYMFLQD